MRLAWTWLTGFVAAALLSGSAVAVAQVPPKIAAQNRALGQKIDIRAAIKTYGPLAERPPYKEARVVRDLSYGQDPRYKLDVFMPKTRMAHPIPVLVYATGGRFTRRIDLPGGSPFYDNVVLWAAKHGMIGVNTDRRYYKGKPWRTGPEDMAAIIGWVDANIAKYGGDPKRVIFLGHAYGGTQLVSYLAHPKFWPGGKPGIAAAAIISAPLNLVPATTPHRGQPPNPMFDPNHSDLAGVRRLTLPLFVASTEFDPPAQKQSEDVLRQQLCAAGHCPTFHVFKNHSHLSVTLSFNTADTSVTGPLERWIHNLRD